MIHIVAAIKWKSDKITHLKVFDDYSFQIYDIATFVMLFAIPRKTEKSPQTSAITEAIQNREGHIRITAEGIVLEGYSDIPILNEKGKILRAGRVIFTQAGKDPIKAIQSGFKEVQCSPRDISRKLVCNIAEYSQMLTSSEYTIKWEDCDSRYKIMFPNEIKTNCFMLGVEYLKNCVRICECGKAAMSLFDGCIFADTTLKVRLEKAPIEVLVLPVAVQDAEIELIDCPKLKSVVCPYGASSLKISGTVGVKVYYPVLDTGGIVRLPADVSRIVQFSNSVGTEIVPKLLANTVVS